MRTMPPLGRSQLPQNRLYAAPGCAPAFAASSRQGSPTKFAPTFNTSCEALDPGMVPGTVSQALITGRSATAAIPASLRALRPMLLSYQTSSTLDVTGVRFSSPAR
jgi:hypothetical protein